MIRLLATILISAYLGAGLFAGLLMQRAVPTLNPLGVAYIGLAWPQQIYCAGNGDQCSTQPPAWLNPYLFWSSK